MTSRLPISPHYEYAPPPHSSCNSYSFVHPLITDRARARAMSPLSFLYRLSHRKSVFHERAERIAIVNDAWIASLPETSTRRFPRLLIEISSPVVLSFVVVVVVYPSIHGPVGRLRRFEFISALWNASGHRSDYTLRSTCLHATCCTRVSPDLGVRWARGAAEGPPARPREERRESKKREKQHTRSTRYVRVARISRVKDARLAGFRESVPIELDRK